MADLSKFEEMLECLVNEDRRSAEELFHEIVVERSRSIYASLLESEEKEYDYQEAEEVDFEDGEIDYSDQLEPVAKSLFQNKYPDADVSIEEDDDGYLTIETSDGKFSFSIGVSHQGGDNLISVANAYAGGYKGIVGKLVQAAVEILKQNHPNAETVLNTQHDVSNNYWTQLANKLDIKHEETGWH